MKTRRKVPHLPHAQRAARGAFNVFLCAALIAGVLAVVPAIPATAGPPGPGFNLNTADLRHIFNQIKISENHAAQTREPGNAPNCAALVGPGPFQIVDPRLPYGLRTVDGRCNNLYAGQEDFGSADRTIPRLTTPVFRPAEISLFTGQPTSFTQNIGSVFDSRPRIISNLIVDQTATNPSAVAAAGPDAVPDPDSGTLPIPNTATDAGLSAQFNAMFTFFGQFFDHGLTLLRKGGSGTVFAPLQPDDPLFVPGSPTNFMVLTRATNLPGPDGILGTADDIKEGTNLDTPFIDQQQTYTSFPSHQVFLRHYALNAQGRPVPTGRLIDGAISGNIANWAEVKAQAASVLGIALADIDVLNVPLLLTDPYGHFVPGPNGFPQVVTPGVLVEGNPAAPVSVAGSLKVGTGFLDDIAHHAVPFGDHDNNPATPPQALAPDADPGTADDNNPATYDDEMLNAHFITGDGRGNENIALTAIHNLFHSEHNRLAVDIDGFIQSALTPAEIAAWTAENPASGWGYGERLFQAARFVTEMEYSRIVIDTFARKVQPQVNGFTGYKTDIDPATTAEFSHASYRFGHSMLLERVARTNANGSVNDLRLLDAFLNPLEYNAGGPAGPLSADQAIGSTARGLSRQVGNEIDEFVTEALRNGLLGLPLDLATINLMRGRSEGVAPLNEVRRQIKAATGLSALAPYPSWFEFGLGLRHPESLVNFVAAYGTHPTITAATTVVAKRAAADRLVALDPSNADAFDFMFGVLAWANTNTGLEDVDLWVGGLAEKPSAFGGLLGATNNYIFETLMEQLQDGDRLYYVPRVRGMNLFSQLEQNSLTQMLMRNSDLDGQAEDPFSRPALVLRLANLGTSGPILDDPTTPDVNESAMPDLIRLPDGTIRYTGIEHIVLVGRDDPGVVDRIWSSEGDDTLIGSAGDDVLEGGQGNDTINGGEGDDILTDDFGDDILQGGDGNDVMFSGPGFGGDIMFGGRGKDFMVGSIDPVATFGDDGDDFIRQGDGGFEALGAVKAGGGDDWVEGGAGLNELFGDCALPFRIDICQTGDDVLIGGNAEDIFVGEGGNDIAVFGPGKEVYRGLFGFDWATYKADPQPGDADLNIAFFDPLEQQVLRDKLKEVEAVSGGPFNDVLLGDDRIFAGTVFVPPVPGMTCDPVVPLALGGATFYCHELTAEGVAKITGLDALLDGKTFPLAEGNVLIGGPGSDIIEGRGGNDIIDGDAWLDVQLQAPDPANPGSFKLVDSMLDLADDVFARLINPRDIFIARSIKSTGASPADVDTALFCDVASNYTITLNLNGSVRVAHLADSCPQPVDPARAANVGDGIDTLWNIEQLAFLDVTIPAPQAAITVALTANPPSPADTGTSVTWTAAASGGSNFQYQFLSGVSGGPLAVVRDFSANPIFNWTDTGTFGAYVFRVNARQGGAGAAEATTSRLYYVGALRPAGEVEVVSDPRSPQFPGTTVVFTAAATGGSAGAYEYQYLLSENGGPFSVAKPYGAAPSFTWTDTGTAGKYFFRVNARQAGSTGPAEATKAITYVIATVIPPTSVALSTDLASPQGVGASIVFTGAATGGTGPLEFRFEGRAVGSPTWALAQGFSPLASWTWNTATVPAGSYEFRVLARNAGGGGAETISPTVGFVLNIGSVTLSTNLASPQGVGASIVFTGAATGGTGPFEFRFEGRAVGSPTWALAQGFSPLDNWTWNTATVPAGNYEFRVLARTAGGGGAETISPTVGFVLNIGSVTLSTNLASPQGVGASIVFTGAVPGSSGPFEFRFEGRAVGSPDWALAQDFSPLDNWTWNTATVPAGNYEFRVLARTAGGVPAEASAATPYTLF